jgi:hypothetical protein
MGSLVGGFPKDIEGILYPTIVVRSQLASNRSKLPLFIVIVLMKLQMLCSICFITNISNRVAKVWVFIEVGNSHLYLSFPFFPVLANRMCNILILKPLTVRSKVYEV